MIWAGDLESAGACRRAQRTVMDRHVQLDPTLLTLHDFASDAALDAAPFLAPPRLARHHTQQHRDIRVGVAPGSKDWGWHLALV